MTRALAFPLTALLLFGCRLPNEDHCLHKDEDANAWCARRDADRPFCSPCEGEQQGCVATEPTEASCPEYTSPGTDTGTDDGTDTGTSSESGTDDGS